MTTFDFVTSFHPLSYEEKVIQLELRVDISLVFLRLYYKKNLKEIDSQQIVGMLEVTLTKGERDSDAGSALTV